MLALLVGLQIFVLLAVMAELHYTFASNYKHFDDAITTAIKVQIKERLEKEGLILRADLREWVSANQLQTPYENLSAADQQLSDCTKLLAEDDVINLFDRNGKWLSSTTGIEATYSFDSGAKDNDSSFVTSNSGLLMVYSMPLTDQSGATTAYLQIARPTAHDFFTQLTGSDQATSVFSTHETRLTINGFNKQQQNAKKRNMLSRLGDNSIKTTVDLNDAQGNWVAALTITRPKLWTTLPVNPRLQQFIWLSAILLIYIALIRMLQHRFMGQPLSKLRNNLELLSGSDMPEFEYGKRKGDLNNVTDVLSRLVVEHRTRESELKLFASAIDVTDDTILMVEKNGDLYYANPSYEKLTGYSVDQSIGLEDWWKRIFSSRAMNYRKSAKDEWEGTLTIRHKSGDSRVVEATSFKMKGIDGEEENKAYYVVVMHDVTEKVAQLAEIEVLATAVKTIDDCILILDKDALVSYANPAYERRYGKTLSELAGKKPSHLFHAVSNIAGGYNDMLITVSQGKVWRGEIKSTTPDGQELVEEAVVSPIINEQGDIAHFVTSLHDVTNRVTMEESLRLAKEKVLQANQHLEARVQSRTNELRAAKDLAEAANRAKSGFLATVSHEIRTPLNGILGMLELFRDHPLTVDQRKLVGSADTSAKLLLALINDILDFSKIEANELALDETAVSLFQTTESVVLALAGTAHRKSLRLQTNLAKDLPDPVLVDGIRLQQILFNLISNAIKFTSTTEQKEGLVTLDVDHYEPHVGKAHLRFSITDNGIGIPEDALHDLFKPFTQAESSTTRRFGGTGLGLTISSRLVSLMGGSIQVTSSEGTGSKFVVLLPLKYTDQQNLQNNDDSGPPLTAEPEQLSAPENKHVAHILVAEDNPINQDVIRLQLSALGFSCDLADDGKDALALWKENHYDIVLTDCHMPLMDGFELAQTIRASEKTKKQTPIIALTANVLSEEAERCRSAGMNECLTKPITRDRLRKSLFHHLTANNTVQYSRPNHTIKNQTPNASVAQRKLFDMQTFASNIGDDRNVQTELLTRFAKEANNNLEECRTALLKRDSGLLKCNAHKLKSAARTIGAEELAAICVQIERASGQRQWSMLEWLIEKKGELVATLAVQIDEHTSCTSSAAPLERAHT